MQKVQGTGRQAPGTRKTIGYYDGLRTNNKGQDFKKLGLVRVQKICYSLLP